MTTTLDGKIKARLAGQGGDIREPDWGPFPEMNYLSGGIWMIKTNVPGPGRRRGAGGLLQRASSTTCRSRTRAPAPSPASRAARRRHARAAWRRSSADRASRTAPARPTWRASSTSTTTATSSSREFQSLIEAHARFLKANNGRRIAIEGHTDERGGREYNLALGQRRSEAVRRALGLLGVTDTQVEAVSFGKEKPAAPGSDEAAWAQNRRAEIVYR